MSAGRRRQETGGGVLETKTKERQGESGQRAAPGAPAVAASNWSTSQPPLLPFSFILSLSKTVTAGLDQPPSKDGSTGRGATPELDPAATDESPALCAVPGRLLIWAR